ncbi:hypothetical protein COW46_04555 [Candidatus Gracilibacteria bacterium CG17_big_fil_post_rev_8_21_14_2_50_48_13]|nr:MAG: hypothetical protein COW46_04555 [Candidatus Gracilibacteria bacterium CG17_big_fil_post_rev_8_21_14_2_50_48_13]
MRSPHSSALHIATEGLSACGKSTIQAFIAEGLNELKKPFLQISNGSLFRALSYGEQQGMYQLTKDGPTNTLEKELGDLPANTIRIASDGAVLLAGNRVQQELYTPEVAEGVFHLAKFPAVQEYVVTILRDSIVHLLEEGITVINDGRSQKYSYLPHTPDVLIFVDRDFGSRVLGRTRQEYRKKMSNLLLPPNYLADCEDFWSLYNTQQQHIAERDLTDTTREKNPQFSKEKAILEGYNIIDNNLPLNEVRENVLGLIRQCVGINTTHPLPSMARR